MTLTFAYDARNRLIQIQDSTGARVTYGYDARGNRLRQSRESRPEKRHRKGKRQKAARGENG